MDATRFVLRVAAAAALSVAIGPMVGEALGCEQAYYMGYPCGQACVCVQNSGNLWWCEPGFSCGDYCQGETGCN